MTQLAILIRNPYIPDSLMGLSVAYDTDNNDGVDRHRRGQRLLEKAQKIAAAANVRMATLNRMSTNIAGGILHTIKEYDCGEVIVCLTDRTTGMPKSSLGPVIDNVLSGSQGEDVKVKQAEVAAKRSELAGARDAKHKLLTRGESEKRSLEGKQAEQQNVVSSLQKQQKTIQRVIDQQRKKDAAINAQIDRLIAQEVARQKARAAAEAKRKAAAEAARERAAELARKKREAEEAARENARRIAEAKALEDKARAEVKAARDKKARDAADRAAHEASQARIAAERKAAADAKRHKQEVAEAKKKSDEVLYTMSSDDRRISGNFESNRGRLPMPITGGYRIVSHFGQYNVEGLNNVRLDNKGINIQGQAGAQARSIFDGEVSGVFSFGGTVIVMVRHGSYISVYCNLSSVNVHRGQKVTARQPLGRIGQDNILQFQLRKETAKLNPEAWLGR